MPEESPGFLHFGKKEEQPEPTPKAPPPPAEEAHGLLNLFKKEEPSPPPPPPPPEGLMARLFHRVPVTPEPASPKRPQLVRHHSFRSALYILGGLSLLASILPDNPLDMYRFVGFFIGAALLLGGILLTGDWHPLTGMFGLRPVRLPTGTGGVAAVLAEHEVKETVEKVEQEAGVAAKPAEPPARRLPPWRWPWSERSLPTAQQEQAKDQRDFKHVGLAGKVLMGVMAGVIGHGAILILNTSHPSSFNAFSGVATFALTLLTIALIIYIIFSRIRSFRRHWLSPFGLIRRVLIFFVVAAIAAVVAIILTKDPMLGQGYGEAVGGLVALLAVLF